MADLGNAKLHIYFDNYHAAIKNKFLSVPEEKVLTVKSSLEDKELQILIQPSYTILDVKPNMNMLKGERSIIEAAIINIKWYLTMCFGQNLLKFF